MTAPTIASVRQEIRATGHDLRCDHDDRQCGKRAEWLVAEQGDHHYVAPALYCFDHVAGIRVASRARVDRRAQSRPHSAVWQTLLNNYPDPVNLLVQPSRGITRT